MNAILREEYEARVLTIEAIEVHLSYLRPGLEAVQAALPILQEKIEQLSERMDSKIEQLSEKMDSKIEQLSEKMDSKIEQLSEKMDSKIEQLSARIDQSNEKIDQANKDRAAGDAALAEKIDQLSTKLDSKFEQFSGKTDAKIDKLTERVLEMQGSQKGLKWFLSSVALIAAATSIAHTFGWI